MQCLRPIISHKLAEGFVRQVLGERNSDRVNKAVVDIVRAEIQIEKVSKKQTLVCDEYRLAPYETDESRIELRSRILDELYSMDRIENDDAISLGVGGSRPANGVNTERQAYLITGLPASGKSMISNPISKNQHAYILDSDYAKRKFPEYDADFGATITHEESSLVVNGPDDHMSQFDDEDSLLARCVKEGYNIVMPRIGHNHKKVRNLAQQLQSFGYSVHLILVRLSREKATQRAYERYRESHRYVPLPLIFDGYANDPTIVYYDLKRENKDTKVFSSFSMVSTDVPKGNLPRLLDYKGDGPILNNVVDFSCEKSYN